MNHSRRVCIGLATALVVLTSGTVFLVHGGKSDSISSSSSINNNKHYDKITNMLNSNSLSAAAGIGGVGKQCQPDHLTVYKVILHTYWNERLFPKHFPQWRPPAQWTKLVGRSHNSSYVLFRLGRKASAGLKIFAEDGVSDALDAQSQGEGGVYDEFNAPPITSGEGRTEAEFFVDGNHSRVSLISKMVPSPDWFIGVDGFDLCKNGKWLDSITIEVDAVDAGTDNGFTFTSPNWPTEPQGVVHRLTSTYPNHPASSFFYPGLKKLPTLASFKFIKVKEYELSEVFHHSENALSDDILKMEHISYVYEEGEGNSLVLKQNLSAVPLSVRIEESQQQQLNKATPLASAAAAAVNQQSHQQQQQQRANVDELVNNKQEPFTDDEDSATSTTTTTANPAAAAGEQQQQHHVNNHQQQQTSDSSIQQQLHGSSVSKKTRPSKFKKGHDFKKFRLPRDCQVAEWSEWSDCSKACGIGESTRTRKVVQHARRGGQPCPPLVEKKWCGSARSCNRRYFNWS